MGGINDDDDNRSVASTASSLPRCHCGWKSCRNYQRAFRDSDPPHQVLDGVIKIKFAQDDGKSVALKAAFDRYLLVDESKQEAWQKGINQYFVARHHFTEALIEKLLKDKKEWDWTTPFTKKEAKNYLHGDELNDEDSAQISDEEQGYLKVPNVPKDVVKDLSSSKSEKRKKSSKSPKQEKKKTAGKSLGDQLESLSIGDNDEEDEVEKPSSSRSKKSSSDDASVKSSKSKSNSSSKSSSQDKDKLASSSHHSTKSGKSSKRGKSPKRDKSKTKTSSLEGKILSVPSLNDDEEPQKPTAELESALSQHAQERESALQAQLLEQEAKTESALEDLMVAKAKIKELKQDISGISQVKEKETETIAVEARNLRQSVNNLTYQHEKTVDVLENDIRLSKLRIKELEDQKQEVADQRNRLSNLSQRRLSMVGEMEKRYQGEVQEGLAREDGLRAEFEAAVEKISNFESSTTGAENSDSRVKALEKELEEISDAQIKETEDFLQSVDDLKKRIESLEEENTILVQRQGNGDRNNTSRGLPGFDGGSDDAKRIIGLQSEVKQLQDKNRKLAYATAPSGAGGMNMQQAIETLERERDSLVEEKSKLAKLNQNQKKVIRTLEGNIDMDNEEARKIARREDDLERGAALLANLYFTKKNMEVLERTSSGIDLETGEENGFGAQNETQAELLKQVMERKQQKWWTSLDGIFSYSNYVETGPERQ